MMVGEDVPSFPLSRLSSRSLEPLKKRVKKESHVKKVTQDERVYVQARDRLHSSRNLRANRVRPTMEVRVAATVARAV